MVTVEAAIATGSLVAVLALVLVTMSALLLQLRCGDAAAEAARLASRDDVDAARRAAAGLVPGDALIAVEIHGDDVVARVESAPLGSALPGLRVGARVVAAREPDEVASGEPGPDTGPDPPSVPPSVPPPVPPPVTGPGREPVPAGVVPVDPTPSTERIPTGRSP